MIPFRGLRVQSHLLALLFMAVGLLTAATLSGCTDQREMDDVGDETVRVMTFNIRWASPNDGANIWDNRSDWVASIIDSSDAHIVGLQEVVHRQLEDIMASQSRFDWVGVGRDDGLQGGEYSPILFDSTRYELVSWDTQWLSATPDSVGSVGWDAALPRIATRVSLRDRRSGQVLRVLNTHFDHRGEEARVQSAAMIRDWASEYDVAMGDFNVEPDTEAYRTLLEGNWTDAGLQPPLLSDEEGTFRTFDPQSETSVRIDYIFHRSEWDVVMYDVLDPVRDGAYPSDHLPVVADLRPNAASADPR